MQQGGSTWSRRRRKGAGATAVAGQMAGGWAHLAVVVPAGGHRLEIVAVHQHHSADHVAAAAARACAGRQGMSSRGSALGWALGVLEAQNWRRSCPALLFKAGPAPAARLAGKSILARGDLRDVCGTQVVVHALHGMQAGRG